MKIFQTAVLVREITLINLLLTFIQIFLPPNSDNAQLVSGLGYTDAFPNRSVFSSLCFQIDPLWIAYSNACVFVIVSSFPCEQEVKPQRYRCVFKLKRIPVTGASVSQIASEVSFYRIYIPACQCYSRLQKSYDIDYFCHVRVHKYLKNTSRMEQFSYNHKRNRKMTFWLDSMETHKEAQNMSMWNCQFS